MMEKKKVTSEALRKMEIGQTVTFELPDANAIDCGKTIAYRLQHSLRCKFSAISDYVNGKPKPGCPLRPGSFDPMN